MESFNALLQKNVLDRQRWATRDQLRYAIIHWIEHTYNHRRQRRLGRLTPVEFELAFAKRSSMITHNNRRPNRQQTLPMARGGRDMVARSTPPRTNHALASTPLGRVDVRS